ncbi:MAG: DUF3303 family protein [Acidobacteriota bacterium]
MKFMVSWKLPQGTFQSAVQRFLATGGAPPKGVKMIGRWHGASMKGVAIAESNDAKAIYAWAATWGDLLEMDVTPCLDDTEGAKVLKSLNT